MYKAYSISCVNSFLEELGVIERENKVIDVKLSDFFDSENNIVTLDLIDKWFHGDKYDVFLSHSHSDEQIALRIQKFLKENFDLRTFVDSQAWFYMDKLIKKLDEHFCKEIEIGKDGTERVYYNYDLRNVTTAHVHNMLSVALNRMMNSCECIFFLNTENSMPRVINKETKSNTYSSWIYSEINNLRTLRLHQPRQTKEISLENYSGHVVAKDSAHPPMKFVYNIDISFLRELTKNDFRKWVEKKNSSDSETHALDILYDLFPMHFPIEKTQY